ncbi:LysR family transcriptional regulator [Frigidibacter sp. MR17.24]|uniref:LysR substrate-binding domain-containing protein n=1 Tax=Frigidibacter sp. MR17.24 TaxID=3127345 RepID=UPI003012DD45
MELRHYRYLSAVRQHLSFAQAARSLGVSVPTLSVHIRYVEERLGLRIFERTSRRVTVTREGEAFLQAAEAVLRAAETAEATGRNLARGTVGEVRIGYVGSAVYAGVLQRVMARFERACPDASLMAQEHVMDDLPRLVADNVVDLALVRGPVVTARGLRQKDVTNDHFVAALSSRHRLPARDGVLKAADLADLPFVLPEQRFGTEEVGRRGGFTPRVIAVPGSLVAVLTQVAVASAAAIVPDLLRDALQVEGVEFYEIDGPQIPSGIVAIWRRDERSPVVRSLIGQLDDALPPRLRTIEA